MKRTRKGTWPEDLFRYIKQKNMTPFAWGTHDCATFASGAVEAMTGLCLFEPTYDNAKDALRFIEEGGGLEAMVTERLGEPVPVAMRGDVVLIPLEDREVLGVCLGLEMAAPGEEHLLYYPTARASKAWRV
jgi:hypothetical protein